MIIGLFLGCCLLLFSICIVAIATENSSCFWGHDWPEEWRSGKVTRNRDGQTARAEGQECLRCGKVRFRPA